MRMRPSPLRVARPRLTTAVVPVTMTLLLIAAGCAVKPAASSTGPPDGSAVGRGERPFDPPDGSRPGRPPIDATAPTTGPTSTTTTTTTTPNRAPRLAAPVSLATRPGTTVVAALPLVDDDGDDITVELLDADAAGTGPGPPTVSHRDGAWELRWLPTRTGTSTVRLRLTDERGFRKVVTVWLRATNRPRPDTLMGLGDSVASGHGLSKRDYLRGDECWRAGDEAYPRLVADLLIEHGVFDTPGDGESPHYNVACSGATLLDLLRTPVGGGPTAAVGGGGDGGDRSQVDWAVAVNPEIITLTAGANTLGFVHPERLLDDARPPHVDRAELERRLGAVRDGLEQVLERLVDRTDATVFVTNYYNPAGPQAQGVPGCRAGCFHELADEVVAELNATIARVAGRFPRDRVVVVDVASRFVGHAAPNGLGPDVLRSGAIGWVRELAGAPVAGVHPYCARGHDDEGSWINYVDCVHPATRGHVEIADAVAASVAKTGA